MRRTTRRNAVTTALAVAVAVPLAAPAYAGPHHPGGRHHQPAHRSPYTFAVIGDLPYGQTKAAEFPAYVDAINADPDVQWVDHLGDIKSGSTTCDNDYFAFIRGQFDRFEDPLVYTPGDNEWTDCHRANNGAYNPLERLHAIRSVFFDRPGRTLGKPVAVRSQARLGVPENVSWTRAGVAFAALHVVGSNNALQPWSGIGNTTTTRGQVVEERQRTDATLRLIHQTFRQAERDGRRAVAMMMQADMFDGTPAEDENGAFRPIVQAIAQEARGFRGPVYLFNGDSHVFEDDNPLGRGSVWAGYYGVEPVRNLTRVTVDGSDKGYDDYLKVRVDPTGREVLSFERVPLGLPKVAQP